MKTKQWNGKIKVHLSVCWILMPFLWLFMNQHCLQCVNKQPKSKLVKSSDSSTFQFSSSPSVVTQENFPLFTHSHVNNLYLYVGQKALYKVAFILELATL